MNKTLTWLPRILAILYAAFISLFALDIFSEGYSFWETVIGLFMHLIPTFILIIVIVIAWKKELIGGVVFLLLGIASIFAFDTYKELLSFLIISLPVFITGSLYLISWKIK